MEIKLDWQHLQTKTKFFWRPQCMEVIVMVHMLVRYVNLLLLSLKKKYLYSLYSLFNESLITRARAYACDEFLRSDATHLLFIDSDVGFSAQDIICMMALMTDDSPYDILGAPYPKKCISWEKIKHAVDKGFADKNPQALDQFVGDFVFNPLPGTQSFSVLEPSEMLEIGTGFMMIKRQTLLIIRMLIQNICLNRITSGRNTSMDRVKFVCSSKPKLIVRSWKSLIAKHLRRLSPIQITLRK